MGVAVAAVAGELKLEADVLADHQPVLVALTDHVLQLLHPALVRVEVCGDSEQPPLVGGVLTAEGVPLEVAAGLGDRLERLHLVEESEVSDYDPPQVRSGAVELVDDRGRESGWKPGWIRIAAPVAC